MISFLTISATGNSRSVITSLQRQPQRAFSCFLFNNKDNINNISFNSKRNYFLAANNNNNNNDINNNLISKRLQPESHSFFKFQHQRQQVALLHATTQTSASGASLSLIKELRAASGAPIVDCKKALQAEGVDGDIEKAFDWLRKKGVASMAKSNRDAKEGLIGIAISDGEGVIVEVNTETDFVARNTDFHSFVSSVSDITLNKIPSPSTPGSFSIERDQIYTTEPTLEASLGDMIAKIRENISLGRMMKLSVNGIIGGYVHNEFAKGMGTQAALVSLEIPNVSMIALSNEQKEDLSLFGKRLAMHVVAAKPQFLDSNSIPQDALDREKTLLIEQAEKSGKPMKVIEKMVEGRLNKFKNEMCLLNQESMIEADAPKISKLIEMKSQELGFDVKLNNFILLSTGAN